MRLFIYLICALVLSSCGKHSDGTSVWAEGLWLVGLLPAIGAAIFWYKAGKQHSGGSWKVIGGWVSNEDGGKIPIWKTPYFVFAVAFTLATIITTIMVNSEK